MLGDLDVAIRGQSQHCVAEAPLRKIRRKGIGAIKLNLIDPRATMLSMVLVSVVMQFSFSIGARHRPPAWRLAWCGIGGGC